MSVFFRLSAMVAKYFSRMIVFSRCPFFFSLSAMQKLLLTFCVLPQLAISEHFTVNLHKSLIGALSFNFARHRQLRQHAVTTSASLSAVVCRSICCYVFHCLLSCGGAFFKISFFLGLALQAL